MKEITGNELAFLESGVFSKIITDYLEEKESAKCFYGLKPSWNNFIEQAREKKFSKEQRKLLISALKKQYEGIKNTRHTKRQLDHLSKENSFTITTGHQLCLFSGPLYFFSKIITVLKCCEEMNKRQDDFIFIPVFWMASEDHDFKEINHFYFQDSKLEWAQNEKGPVGRLSTKSLQSVFDEFLLKLTKSPVSGLLVELFKTCYLNSETLAEATRKFVHHWFGEHGVIIVDGDDEELKRSFSSIVRGEIESKASYMQINNTNQRLIGCGYPIQIAPREINLFYMGERFRERIVEKNHRFFINNTNLSFSKADILEESKKHPERFSPNVLLRPIYQEQILPNICYVGGAGELAYWLELKDYFVSQNTQFPIILLRNFVLVLNRFLNDKLMKLRIEPKDLFLHKDQLDKVVVRRNSNLDLGFERYDQTIHALFEKLETIAKKTDPSFIGAVRAQKQKQKNGLKKLENSLLKAEKRKLNDCVLRAQLARESLFPKGFIQDRSVNISTFLNLYGPQFFDQLMEKIKPLENEISIFIL